MLRRVVAVAKPLREYRRMSILAATEEFPFSANLSPKSPSSAVIAESTSSSGIKIISRDALNSGVVNLKVVIKGGSSSEGLSERGSAHLLSVTAFSGTAKSSGLRLMRDLENLGAVVKASADREKISYELSVTKDNLPAAFKALAEAVTLPLKAPHALEERKPVAQIDIDTKSTNPSALLSDLLHESIFGEGSPLGNSIYASKLEKISYSDVLSYRNKVFVTGNTVVVGNGISVSELQKLVEANLCLPHGTTPAPASPYVGGGNKLRLDIDDSYGALAYGVSGPDSAKISAILNAVLRSRLAPSSSKGYSVAPFSVAYSGLGVVGVYVSAPPSQIGVNFQLAADELRAIAKGTAKAQIEAAKAHLSLAATLALEGDGATNVLASAALSGQSPSSLISYSGITASKVEEAASALLSSTPSYAIVGATSGAPSYQTVVDLSKSAGVVKSL